MKRKIPLTSSSSTATLDSLKSLHQALHHPSIVSLLSTFATPSAHFHVLELCSHGSLSTFLHTRDPPILSEGELRGLLGRLIDALVYLKKELVIHRGIEPSNILLTSDYRIVGLTFCPYLKMSYQS
jgi:Serine/threonine protein kinase